MADEAGIVLLEKKEEDEHQNFPGCYIDRVNHEHRGVPYLHLSFIWLVSLCIALPISSLFPYLYFMAYASEVVSEEYHSLNLSVVSTSRGIGLILGPAIGGYLAQPAEKYPNIFFPEFCFWEETLHMCCGIAHGGLDPNGTVNSLNDDGSRDDQKIESKASLMRNLPLMASIIVYCVFSLQEIAYLEIFSLWAVSDKSYGGLSFSSQDVGQVLAISGLGLLVFQLLVYPPLEKPLGLLAVIRLFAVSLVTGLFILLNKFVPQSQRGAANGISMTAMSIFKSFGPAGGGDGVVFFVLNLVQLVGLILTFIPYISHTQ